MAPAPGPLDVHARLSVLEAETATLRNCLERMIGMHGAGGDPTLPRTQFDHPLLLALPKADDEPQPEQALGDPNTPQPPKPAPSPEQPPPNATAPFTTPSI
jgi:hypothetical protein